MIRIIIFLFPIWTYAQCSKIDVLLVGDMSGSVYGHEQEITDAFSAFVSGMDLSEEGVKIGVIMFNNTAFVTNLTSDKALLLKSLSDWSATGTTNMTSAFYAAADEFSKREAIRVLVLVSDGQPDRAAKTLAVAQQLKIMNIKIFGFFLGGGGGEDFMKLISDYYMKSNYEGLINELKKLDICL